MSSKYSYMSDAEFVRFAQDMVGDSLYQEALSRLERLSSVEADHDKHVEELEEAHEIAIYRLESRIEDLESELEHA